MKRKTKQSKEKLSTIIGQDIIMEGGVLKGTNAVRIDGTIIGEIHVDGCLVIGETGKVKGNIKGSDVLVAGTVEGNIYCTGQVYLNNSCHVTGDITYKHIVIDEGANFTGRCIMDDKKEAEQYEPILALE